jgi:hypothetical protein
MNMRNYKSYLAIMAILAVAFSGCLVSGTFPIVEDVEFSFTANTGFYWYPIDLNDNEDWEEHKDELDDIEAIGFDFMINNTSEQDCEFTVMFRAVDPDIPAIPGGTPTSSDPDDYTVVIDGLAVASHTTRHVTYAESLGMIQNQAALKAIIMTGRFDYLGFSCGGTGDDLFIVTEGKVIITVAASDS